MKDFALCFQKLKEGGFYKGHYEIHLHMIDWKTLVSNSQLRSNVDKCHINSQISEERKIFNLCAPDVLQYLSPHFRLQIHTHIVTQANQTYQKLLSENPKFKGRVSLVGHSLGTVILYDLTLKQRTPDEIIKQNLEQNENFDIWEEDQELQFDFQIENLFLLGSPVACFTAMYAKEQYIRDKLPTVENFYNIYHPSDLVAYRIEPIIKPHP